MASFKVGCCALVLAATASLAATPSFASVELSYTPAGPTDISWYQLPLTIQFDLSSYLSNGQKIVSARAIASAATPSTGYYPRTGASHTEYVGDVVYQISENQTINYEVYNTTTDYFYEDLYQESILLDTGEGSATGQVPYRNFGTLYNVFLQEVHNEPRLDRYFANIFNEGYAGTFSATAELTANDLLALNETGLMSFTVSGLGITHAFLESASFQFELASAVPEPASWALMILGFGAAGGMMRRRARPSAA
jgi:hypothetical protein